VARSALGVDPRRPIDELCSLRDFRVPAFTSVAEQGAAGPITTSEMRDHVGAGPQASEPRSRTYVDDDGMCWHVSERPFAEYDRRRGTSLIFASDLAVRRVRDYPADWYSLPEPQLIALSWRK
jgi:hypothetical protein